jgi:hypothetical protein
MQLTQRDCINLANRIWTAPNEWNRCLDAEARMWSEILKRGGLEMVCETMRKKRYQRPPWEIMPPEGERIQFAGTLPLPGDGTENVIFTFRMEKGWDGVITIVSNTYEGAGFVDGSGDLTWRLQVGARFIPDMGNVLFQTSNMQNPAPLEGGYIRLLSQQQVTGFVHVGGTASVRLTPPGRLNSVVVGWKYPRR